MAGRLVRTLGNRIFKMFAWADFAALVLLLFPYLLGCHMIKV